MGIRILTARKENRGEEDQPEHSGKESHGAGDRIADHERTGLDGRECGTESAVEDDGESEGDFLLILGEIRLVFNGLDVNPLGREPKQVLRREEEPEIVFIEERLELLGELVEPF